MHEETITVPNGTSNGVILVSHINKLATEIGELSSAIVRDGTRLVYKYLEIGEALTTKKSEVDKFTPGAWVSWCNENLNFSKDSEERYRSLFRNSARVRKGLEDGEIVSLRTAIAVIEQEAAEGGDDGKPSTKPAKAEEMVEPTTKLGRAMAKFWSVIHRNPPEKWNSDERNDFLIDLAEREGLRRKQGWKVIDVEAETI